MKSSLLIVLGRPWFERLARAGAAAVLCCLVISSLLAASKPDLGHAVHGLSPTNAALSGPKMSAPVLEDPSSDMPQSKEDSGSKSFIHSTLRESERQFLGSNLLTHADEKGPNTAHFNSLLEEAIRQRQANNRTAAEKLLGRLIEGTAPPETKKTALLELAVLARDNADPLRAQQVYAQFLREFPNDRAAPEVLLRQGILYREIGAPVMALSKFYAVMSSALNLKLDRLEYYQRLVLRAQSEIADTYYWQAKHADAVEFFNRLLKLDSPELDRPKIHAKLIRCLAAQEAHAEVMSSAKQYLDRYPDGEAAAEIRFLLSKALTKLGRNDDAMEQVLALLQSQRRNAEDDPESWKYWRQRTGNEIANQFYQQANFTHALQIYLNLAQLNTAPEWQLPALYQAGLVYERLGQPDKALDAYGRIIESTPRSGSTLSPSLVAVLDMANWRKAHLSWYHKAQESTQRLLKAPSLPQHHE